MITNYYYSITSGSPRVSEQLHSFSTKLFKLQFRLSSGDFPWSSAYSNNKINIAIGLSKVEDIVLTVAVRTNPDESDNMFVILANSQTFLGVLSSMTRTSYNLELLEL